MTSVEKNEFTPPAFVDKLKDLKVRDGESLTLKTSVKGDPEPQIQWLKNGTHLSSSDVIDLKYKSGVATLSINEVFPEDEGEYECIATNSVGKDSTKCKLTIIRKQLLNSYCNCSLMQSFAAMESKAKKETGPSKPPRIIEHLTSLSINDGQPITLKCLIKCKSKWSLQLLN